MIRYERHTTVLDNIKRIEDVSREDIETALFMRRINKMEKDAIDSIAEYVKAYKARLNPIKMTAENLLGRMALGAAGAANVERAFRDASNFGLGAYYIGPNQLMQSPYANGQAKQQIPRNYLGLLGGFPW